MVTGERYRRRPRRYGVERSARYLPLRTSATACRAGWSESGFALQSSVMA